MLSTSLPGKSCIPIGLFFFILPISARFLVASRDEPFRRDKFGVHQIGSAFAHGPEAADHSRPPWVQEVLEIAQFDVTDFTIRQFRTQNAVFSSDLSTKIIDYSQVFSDF